MVGRQSSLMVLAAGFALAGAWSPAAPPKASNDSPAQKPPTVPAIAAPVAPAVPGNPLTRQRRQRRQQWEKALQAPAGLTVGDQKSITLGVLLDQIRTKHGLNVRIDMPHILPMASAFEAAARSAGPGRSANVTALMPFSVWKDEESTTIRGSNSPSYNQHSYYPSQPTAPVYAADPTPSVPSSSPSAGRFGPPSAGPKGSPIPPPTTFVLPPTALAPSFAPGDEEGSGFIPTIEGDASPRVTPVNGSLPASKNGDAVGGTTAKQTGGKKGKGAKGKKANDGGKEAPPKSGVESNGTAEVAVPVKPHGQAIDEALKKMLDTPIDSAVVAQPEATVEDVLRHAFERAFPFQAMLNAAMSDEFPLLASLTQATEWDLLVRDDGVLVTTRLNANLQKETRVYSLRELEQSSKLKPEDVARVVTRTVRPWSWRKHFPEANAETKTGGPASPKTNGPKKITVPKVNVGEILGLLLTSSPPVDPYVRLTSDEETSFGSSSPASSSDKVELTEEDLALLGRAWDGLFQWAVTSLQVIYHAEPPSGVVEVLPGMLIISQSQGAHREIADLLEQLAHPEN
jgi:hypothetical protein